MLKLLLTVFIFTSHPTLASSQQVNEYADDYLFQYTFKDHQNALQEFQWQYNKWKINNYILSFGLKAKQGTQFRVDNNELQQSDMYLEGGDLYFKYDQVINNSKSIVAPLYLRFKSYIQAHQLKRREQVELIMRFLQDIPYYIPPMNYQDRFIGGLFPPSEVLKHGKGDCDSKSVLMAAILSHDPFYYDKLAMILVPGHALLAIEAPPLAYDQYIEFQGRTFVYAEPVGPRRTPFGKTNSPYSTSIEVFPLKLYPPALPTSKPNSNSKGPLNCPDGGLLIEYERPFAPEIVKSCQIKIEGNYVKHGPTVVINKENGQEKSRERYHKGSKL